MTTTEAERLRLLQRLEEVLGPDEATTLMDHLPPLGWSDVATKHDLDANRVLTKSDLDLGLNEFRLEFGEFRAEMHQEFAEFRVEMRGEMADFKAEMRSEMAALRVEMHQGFRNQILALVSLMFAMMALYTGLVVTILR